MLSRALASERNLRVGDTFTLPSPDATSFRVAALSTNLGWVPGAVIMNAADYARAWESDESSAFSILFRPGFPPEAAAREIQRAIEPRIGSERRNRRSAHSQQAALSRKALGPSPRSPR